MFGKVASEALGLSDIGKVIEKKDFDKTEADDYVMNEDGEEIFFLIKSKRDEYCFTNQALIHVDGTSATSKKRTLKRYDYHRYEISNVSLETAGTVDLDVEIKFTLGGAQFSIDVNKKHLEELKDLYKALLKIAELTQDNNVSLGHAKQSLELASTTLGRARVEGTLHEELKEMNQLAFDWLQEARKQYHIKDFGFVFERYINN